MSPYPLSEMLDDDGFSLSAPQMVNDRPKYEIRRFDAAIGKIRGYVTQKATGRVYDEESEKLRNATTTHRRFLIERPAESARIINRVFNEKLQRMIPVSWSIGGSTLCAVCDEPFGKSEQTGADTWRPIEAVKFAVLEEVGAERPYREIFCCFDAAACEATFQRKLKKGDITPISHHKGVDMTHRTLPVVEDSYSRLPVCALPGCGERFRAYYGADQRCCTEDHERKLRVREGAQPDPGPRTSRGRFAPARVPEVEAAPEPDEYLRPRDEEDESEGGGDQEDGEPDSAADAPETDSPYAHLDRRDQVVAVMGTKPHAVWQASAIGKILGVSRPYISKLMSTMGTEGRLAKAPKGQTGWRLPKN